MNINDVKISTLMLMFANYADDLRDVDIDELSDTQYTKYTVNMDSSINRAIGRIESARVLPLKSVVLTKENGMCGEILSRWELTALASDYLAVSRVILESNWGYESSVSYELEGDTIVLPSIGEGEKYVVLYYRKVKRIAIACPSSTAIDLPDEIAEMIPYWVKADLYEEDEPNLSVVSRNLFEQMLDSITPSNNNGQGCVKNLYGGLL